MNCKCNIKVIFAFVYIIVYLVIRIYDNPKFEFFTASQNDLTLDAQVMAEIEKDKERFLKQEREQTTQNRKIAELKRKIDEYRNDIVIYKNNDQDDTKSIYKKMGYDDSVAEALSASGGDLNTALKTVERTGKKNGKNYNFNFNLNNE